MKNSANIIHGPWGTPDNSLPHHLEETALEAYHELVALRQRVQYLGLGKTAQLLNKAEDCLKDTIISAYLKNRQEEDRLFAQNFSE